MTECKAKPFQEKVCVVTGGASGIGQCLTRTFANVGAQIAFIDKDKKAGLENEEYLKERGTKVLFFLGDVGEKESLEAFAKEIIEVFGKVDILIHNALPLMSGIHDPCSYEDFNEALRVGVTAPYWLTQLLIAYLGPDASIVNISSTRAMMSQANTESYSAAKGGIHALTHALAVSLSGKARVNAIAPGWIDTGSSYDSSYEADYSSGDILQHPSRRVGNPEDVAQAALFLCDPRNSFMNGECLVLDGGVSKRMIYHMDEGWEYHGK